MIRTPLERFKTAVKAGTPVAGGAVVHKLMSAVVESGEGRQVKFTISTGSVDRDNDTVAVNGWMLDAYMGNPVVLWGHDASHLPIGKCVAIGAEGDALRAIVEFVPADMPHVGDKAEAVLRMCKTGFLSATSVGFRPLEYDIATSREDDNSGWFMPMNFLRQELLEFSIVSIPANAEALIDPAERPLPVIGRATAADEEKIARAHAGLAERRRARLRAYI